MNKLLLCLVLIVSLLGCGSIKQAEGPPDPIAAKMNADQLVEHTGNVTVALVRYVPRMRQVLPYCTGVFISETDILTAAHCVIDDDELEENEDYDPFADTYHYSVRHEMTDVWKSPQANHKSKLVRVDMKHDLALLRVVGEAPTHSYAALADDVKITEQLLLVGHPSGHTYTYLLGTVSAVRKTLPGISKTGPWVQVNASIWMGNSGGGAFNDRGELVGIASFLTKAAPNCAMYIHRDTIAWFLASNQLVL